MEIFDLVFLIIVFLFSVVIHEVAHGIVADSLGDPTARLAGRLTLNPLSHLDPIGSIFLPGILLLLSKIFGRGIIFGWAKPVPINPYNLRDQKYGEAKVAVAGPLSNILIALLFGIPLRFIPTTEISFFRNLEFFSGHIVWVNLILAVFNLIPIPPLDGSHILFTFLPRINPGTRIVLERYSFLILIFIIFFLFDWIIIAVNFIYQAIVGIPFL